MRRVASRHSREQWRCRCSPSDITITITILAARAEYARAALTGSAVRRVRHARAAFDVVCGVHHHHHHHDRHHPHDSFVFVFFFSQAMVQGFAARLQAELRDADVPNADLSQVMSVVACCCACGMIVVVS